MTPKKLTLQNFLGYGEPAQQLDFDSFSLAILTGDNGAGKSSLLEAIPWCIWGEGRGKSSTDIIRASALETRVEYEFSHQKNQEKNLFRIIRQLKRGKNANSSQTTLEFQVYDKNEEKFITLSGSGVRDTQSTIEKTLGLSYETFMNSSFLAQGKADEFTEKSASKRKEVLAEILGARKYQSLSESAAIKVKEGELQSKNLEGKIAAFESDLEALPRVEVEIDNLLGQIQREENELKPITLELNAMEEMLTQLTPFESQFAVETAKQVNLEKQFIELRNRLRKKELEAIALSKELIQKGEIEKEYAELEQLRMQTEIAEKAAIEYQTLQTQLLETKSRLESVTIRMKSEVRSLEQNQKAIEEKRITEKNTYEKNKGLTKRAFELEEKLKETEVKLEQLEKENEIFITTEKEQVKFASLKEQLETRIAEANRERNKIKDKGISIKDETQCPLCKSPLDPNHKDHILTEYRKEYLKNQEEEKVLQNELNQLNHLLQENAQKLEKWKRELQQIPQLKSEIKILLYEKEKQVQALTLSKKAFESMQILEQEAVALSQKKQFLEKELLEGKEIIQLKSQLDILHERKTALGFEKEKFEMMKLKLKRREVVTEQLSDLKNAERRLNSLREEIKEGKDLEAEMQKEIEETLILINQLREKVAQKEQVANRFSQKHKIFREREKMLISSKATLEALNKESVRLQEKADELGLLQNDWKALKDEIVIHAYLKEAFGIKGIQTMLIENAVNEIELLANQLLSEISQNTASIQFRLNRSRASGLEIDTLDIILSDVNGNERDYSTFSGGEKFRIDFSIRLALSELLAKQSGVGVKMLVIDEGFGTQDEDGVQAITESILRVQDRFEKIVVISHINEMKDAFETRINISKDAMRGSLISLSS
ncbi:MAG: SMC family ATPase [Chloroherpetonaceae bacterium]|nr:SMC family ATPase [Chloroherpetonaceae bacterium]